jgi:hypothetical protein
MFGQMDTNEEERNKIIEEANEAFVPWEGVISRTILWDDEKEIASTIYFCKTYESAVKAREHVHSMREKYDPFIGYTTELLGEVKGCQSSE